MLSRGPSLTEMKAGLTGVQRAKLSYIVTMFWFTKNAPAQDWIEYNEHDVLRYAPGLVQIRWKKLLSQSDAELARPIFRGLDRAYALR